IPYSGSGILPSAIGMNKAFQKKMLAKTGLPTPKFTIVKRGEWLNELNWKDIYDEALKRVGGKIVIRPANQGSSIGVTIVDGKNKDEFNRAIDKGFFIRRISQREWTSLSKAQKVSYIRSLTDIREGIGLPVLINGTLIEHPEELLSYIEE